MNSLLKYFASLLKCSSLVTLFALCFLCPKLCSAQQADSHRQAAALYRQAAASCPANAPVYNQCAAYEECQAAAFAKGGQCNMSAPSCEPTKPCKDRPENNNSASSGGVAGSTNTTNNTVQVVNQAFETLSNAVEGMYRRRQAAREARHDEAEELIHELRERDEAIDAERDRRKTATDSAAETEENQRLSEREQAYAEQQQLSFAKAALKRDLAKTAGDLLEGIQDYTRSKSRELLEQQIESAPDTLLSMVDVEKRLSSANPLRDGVGKIVNDLLEQDPRTTVPSTIGDWVKDKVAEKIADWGTEELKEKLDEQLKISGAETCHEEGNVGQAYCELWRVAHPVNLTQGLKPYLQNVVNKFNTFFGLATDNFLGIGDTEKGN
jgi:hypothetical protein